MKDPAAVALGKRRQASMTPEERARFQASGVEASKSLSPAALRERARKAARTRRLRPAWMKPAPAVVDPARNVDPPAVDVDAIARAIDALPDEAITRLAAEIVTAIHRKPD